MHSGVKVHWTEGLFVRRCVGSKVHWTEGMFVRIFLGQFGVKISFTLFLFHDFLFELTREKTMQHTRKETTK